MNIIDSGPQTAANNMETDARLLQNLAGKQEMTLHFYDWLQPAATYGCFCKPSEHFHDSHSLDIAKRPTGGGIILHLTDFTFSLVVPASHPSFSLNTMENYKYVHEKIAHVLALFDGKRKYSLLPDAPSKLAKGDNFCMAKPTQYDVMAGNQKAAGGAQRRTRHGYLHQGSISLLPPSPSLVQSLFKHGFSIADLMFAHSFPLLEGTSDIAKDKGLLKKLISNVFTGRPDG
jgi:lipoate-protein ligase A